MTSNSDRNELLLRERLFAISQPPAGRFLHDSERKLYVVSQSAACLWGELMAQIRIRYISALISLVCLIGCSARHVDEQTRALAREPIYCMRGEDCEAKWHRAVDFIGSHSGFRLKEVSDRFAQTAGPKGHHGIATTLRKRPFDEDLYRIAVAVDCGANFVEKTLCRQDQVVQYVAALKQTVNNSLPPVVTQGRGKKKLTTENIGPSPTSDGSVGDSNSSSELPMTIIH
jgi:hypothetical protein